MSSLQMGGHPLQIFPEVLADFRMLLKPPPTAAWIIQAYSPMLIPLAGVVHSDHTLGSRHGAHSVGELDFSACAGSGVVQNVENYQASARSAPKIE